MAPLADPVRDRAIVCLGFNSVSSFRRNRRRARVDLALLSSRRGLRRHKPAVCSSPILHSYSPPGQAAVSAQLSPPTPSAQVRRFPPLGPARASLLPRSRSPVHGSLWPFRRPVAPSLRFVVRPRFGLLQVHRVFAADLALVLAARPGCGQCTALAADSVGTSPSVPAPRSCTRLAAPAKPLARARFPPAVPPARCAF
jgi:hypothetical protein